MNREQIIEQLVQLNPKAKLDRLTIYADSYLDYQEATKNILDHGNIVAHPRTGQPIDNPYIKIKARATAVLRKIGGSLKTDCLWS